MENLPALPQTICVWPYPMTAHTPAITEHLTLAGPGQAASCRCVYEEMKVYRSSKIMHLANYGPRIQTRSVWL